MKKFTLLAVMLAIVTAIVCAGCSEEPMTLRERIRNAPGRTGILLEKKRYSLYDEELIIRDFFRTAKAVFFWMLDAPGL